MAPTKDDGFLTRFMALADRPDDDDESRLKHRFLILAGTLMSGGGLLWGSIAAWAGLYFESLFPFGYVVVTAVNLAALAVWKHFAFARTVQVAASILLPFLFQWSLGGFGTSGGMLYWGMVGVIGSLSFEDLNKTKRWIGLFATLVVISAVVDGFQLISAPRMLQDFRLSALFFGLNFIAVSSVVFWLTLFFVRSRHQAMRELEGKHLELAESKAAAEAASRRADAANEARGRFLAVVSHEMRTPLNGILGLTNLVLDTRLEPRPREMLRQVVVSADTLLAIINDVLDFSKIEAGGVALESIPFRLDQVLYQLSSTATALASKRGIEFVLQVDAVPSVLVGDPTRLGQILLNLVSNAIKFTEVGEVVVTLRGQRLDDDRVALSVAVRDTGVGIAADARERLFQPFEQADDSTTRRYGGTGLGLPICKHFVELMGGRLELESTVGEGSTFHFDVELGYEADPPRAMPEELVGIRALVVDDNAAAREVLLGYLDGYGISADAVDSGEAALALGEQQRYGLVLVDLRMPGIDGIEVIRQLRARPSMRGARLVLVTAVGGPADRNRASIAGADGYLTKPVRSSTLLDLLMEAFAPGKVRRQDSSQPRRREFPGLRGRRVLVVEDNEINREILVAALTGRGLEVATAVDGLEGVREARRQFADLDAILMDLHMPNLDGIAATQQIRSFARAVPIIGVTANALADVRAQCVAAGMDDVVTKPIHVDLLLAVLQRLVAGSDEARDGQAEIAAFLDEGVAVPRAVDVASELAGIAGLDAGGGLTRSGGDAHLYRDLLRRFASNYRDSAAQLRGCVSAGAWAEADRIAHTLRGVAGNIGATAVFELTTSLRAAIEAQDNERLVRDLRQLEDTLEPLCARLQAVLTPDPITEVGAGELDRFRALLRDCDPEAAEVFTRLRSYLETTRGQILTSGLGGALERYDFDEAARLLTEHEGGLS